MARTTYHCRELGATIYDRRLAALLSDRGYTVTARTGGPE